jgi:hypothetical protein
LSERDKSDERVTLTTRRGKIWPPERLKIVTLLTFTLQGIFRVCVYIYIQNWNSIVFIYIKKYILS